MCLLHPATSCSSLLCFPGRFHPSFHPTSCFAAAPPSEAPAAIQLKQIPTGIRLKFLPNKQLNKQRQTACLQSTSARPSAPLQCASSDDTRVKQSSERMTLLLDYLCWIIKTGSHCDNSAYFTDTLQLRSFLPSSGYAPHTSESWSAATLIARVALLILTVYWHCVVTTRGLHTHVLDPPSKRTIMYINLIGNYLLLRTQNGL